jgi:hypothetical protein
VVCVSWPGCRSTKAHGVRCWLLSVLGCVVLSLLPVQRPDTPSSQRQPKIRSRLACGYWLHSFVFVVSFPKSRSCSLWQQSGQLFFIEDCPESTTDRSCNASAPQPYGVLAVGRRPEDKRKGTFVAVWTGSKPPAKSKPFILCVGVWIVRFHYYYFVSAAGASKIVERRCVPPLHSMETILPADVAVGRELVARQGQHGLALPIIGTPARAVYPSHDTRTETRRAAEPATVTLQSCTAPGRADDDGIIPLPMPRRARFQLPSTLPPPPPRDTTDATALQLSSPTTKAVARWRAARRLLTPTPRIRPGSQSGTVHT